MTCRFCRLPAGARADVEREGDAALAQDEPTVGLVRLARSLCGAGKAVRWADALWTHLTMHPRLDPAAPERRPHVPHAEGFVVNLNPNAPSLEARDRPPTTQPRAGLRCRCCGSPERAELEAAAAAAGTDAARLWEIAGRYGVSFHQLHRHLDHHGSGSARSEMAIANVAAVRAIIVGTDDPRGVALRLLDALAPNAGATAHLLARLARSSSPPSSSSVPLESTTRPRLASARRREAAGSEPATEKRRAREPG